MRVEVLGLVGWYQAYDKKDKSNLTPMIELWCTKIFHMCVYVHQVTRAIAYGCAIENRNTYNK